MHAGFLVPALALSQNKSNSLGMSNESWSNCFQCDSPGQCTSVFGGPSKDQMGLFRNRTLAMAASTDAVKCNFLPRYPFSYSNSPGIPGINGIQSLTCRYVDCNLVVNVSIDTKVYSLKEYQSQAIPELVSYNVTRVPTNGGDMRALLLIQNNGAQLGTFGVVPVQCCLNDGFQGLSCDDEHVVAQPSLFIPVSPNERATLESDLNFETTNGSSGTGGCDFKLVDADGKVHFYTYVFFSSIQPAIGLGSPSPGDLPKQAVVTLIITLFGAPLANKQILMAR